MNGFYSLLIAVSMYSRIPVPSVAWTKDRMKHVMSFFPVVGILQGLALGLWFFTGFHVLGLSPAAVALISASLPFLVNGGIHMDGFLDTMDALHSYENRERKLEILKDPHMGAFAFIGGCVYMLLYAAAVYEYTAFAFLQDKALQSFLWTVPLFLFVMERAFSGLSVVCFPPAKKDGLAAGFAGASGQWADRAVLCLWIFLCMAAFAAMEAGGFRGAAVLGGALTAVNLLIFIWYYRMSKREFGGVTGDLAGCFLQICELAGYMTAILFLKSGMAGGVQI